MSDFKWRHYQGEIILGCVRWYYKCGTSYRDIEINGIISQHQGLVGKSMTRRAARSSQTYVKIKGKWCYLYRAIDKRGNTIDFYLSITRNAKAAKRFLGKALKRLKPWSHPQTINTDKAPSYISAISDLAKEGKCPPDIFHRSVKYLNNRIESDHGKLKRLIKPTLGFKSMKTAYATLKDFEIMLMFKKGQFKAWFHEKSVMGEIRLINRQFDI